jgi:hypothetical protein
MPTSMMEILNNKLKTFHELVLNGIGKESQMRRFSILLLLLPADASMQH